MIVKKATWESKVAHKTDYSKQETEEIEQKENCARLIYIDKKYIQLKQIKKVIN